MARGMVAGETPAPGTMKNAKQRGYLHRLLAAQFSRPDLHRPGASFRVQHDRQCARMNGRLCDCHPAITLRSGDALHSVDGEGRVEM